MSRDLLDLVRELNTLNDDNLADRVIENSDVQWCLSELQDILEEMPTLTPPNEALPVLVNDEPGREYIDYICPKCRNIISQQRRGQRMETVYQCKYHDNCGQRVDWTNPQPDRRPPEGEEDT